METLDNLPQLNHEETKGKLTKEEQRGITGLIIFYLIIGLGFVFLLKRFIPQNYQLILGILIIISLGAGAYYFYRKIKYREINFKKVLAFLKTVLYGEIIIFFIITDYIIDNSGFTAEHAIIAVISLVEMITNSIEALSNKSTSE